MKSKLHYEINEDGSLDVCSGPIGIKEMWDRLGVIKCHPRPSEDLDKKFDLVYTWHGTDCPLLEWEIQAIADKIQSLNRSGS